MKWWKWVLIIGYHVLLAYSFGSHIKGSPLF